MSKPNFSTSIIFPELKLNRETRTSFGKSYTTKASFPTHFLLTNTDKYGIFEMCVLGFGISVRIYI